MLDWNQCTEVERHPDVVSGAWVFKGTRLPVATVFDNLSDGMTLEEVYEQFQSATLAQMQAVLEFASRSLGERLLAS